MKLVNWILVILGIFGLISVRILEDELFYDPFLKYFQLVSKNAPFPDVEWMRLVFHHGFRLGLNLVFSLLIIHFMFKRKDWTIQAGIMILLVFLITFPIYLYCIATKFEAGYLFSFYMRRFVIQPVIILLIIPIFYYRKHLNKIKR